MDKKCNLTTLSIDQKLFLWKQYDDHVNQIDAALVNVTAIVSAVLAIMATFNAMNNMLLYSIPIATIFFLYYISYQQRVTEILRGYLCYIENDILKQTGATEISWSIFGVMENYNVKYFRAQKLCGVLFACYIIPLVIYVFYNLYYDQRIPKVIFFAYVVSFLFFSISFTKDLIDNGKVHKVVAKELEKNSKDFVEKYYNQ